MQLLDSIRVLPQLNIIQLSQKSTPSDAFDEIQQVVLDGIRDNVDSLVESGKYGSINTTYTTTNGFYLSSYHQKHIHYMKTKN